VAPYFFDTSALLKVYHPEAGTRRVEEIFQSTANRLIISRLASVEMESAFSKKIRTGVISADERRRFSAKFYLDLGSRLTVIAMTEIHFSLAVAAELHEQKFIDALVSADAILAEVAQTAGITVINPLIS
jgi:predicted nucleic acid-binding protein